MFDHALFVLYPVAIRPTDIVDSRANLLRGSSTRPAPPERRIPGLSPVIPRATHRRPAACIFRATDSRPSAGIPRATHHRLRPANPSDATAGLRPANPSDAFSGLRPAFPEQSIPGYGLHYPERRIPGLWPPFREQRIAGLRPAYRETPSRPSAGMPSNALQAYGLHTWSDAFPASAGISISLYSVYCAILWYCDSRCESAATVPPAPAPAPPRYKNCSANNSTRRSPSTHRRACGLQTTSDAFPAFGWDCTNDDPFRRPRLKPPSAGFPEQRIAGGQLGTINNF